jgi:hypothetical protein
MRGYNRLVPGLGRQLRRFAQSRGQHHGHGIAVSQWMGLTGERSQRLGDLTQCGLGVDADGDLPAGVGVACVAVGDRLAEVPFDPGEGGVAQPVGADLVAGGPGQVAAAC